MADRPGLFAAPKLPVLSLNAAAEQARPPRGRSQFEVLVRHLIYRFFHNELLASDNETSRVMQIAYATALPTLVVSLYLFPLYHAFPPMPFPRPFWPQVGDRYFYVMYSFLIMGAATVYEWDLLFPDLLDVFVLSVLPISMRRLFFARVLALAIFLVLVLVGTSILGILSYPVAADLPNSSRQILGHTVSVLMSGGFGATSFLALQGILLNTVGERVFRRVTPLIQGGSILLLLAVLLLYPTLSHSLEALLTSGIPAVRWFPPFWFLGVYERLLQGPGALPIFGQLARTAWIALISMLAAVLVTYPLAYRRRVRQLIEGASAIDTPKRASAPLRRVLHKVLLRAPGQRAIFHFVGQSVLRWQRQRVMLALYGGLAVALALANMLVLHVDGGHLRPVLLPYGIRAAVPIMTFWTVIGLSSIVSAPIDRRGSWLFQVAIGRAGPGHLAGTRLWITFWAISIGIATVGVLYPFSPVAMTTPLIVVGQLVVAAGIGLLLTDLRLFSVRVVPLTHLRTSSITDFPLMVLYYFVLFPLLVAMVVDRESWIESSAAHFLETMVLIAIGHVLFRMAHTRSLEQSTIETPPGEGEEFLQSLGLRDP